MFYLIKNKQMTNPHENLSLTAHNKNIEIWQLFLILVKFHFFKKNCFEKHFVTSEIENVNPYKTLLNVQYFTMTSCCGCLLNSSNIQIVER